MTSASKVAWAEPRPGPSTPTRSPGLGFETSPDFLKLNLSVAEVILVISKDCVAYLLSKMKYL